MFAFIHVELLCRGCQGVSGREGCVRLPGRRCAEHKRALLCAPGTSRQSRSGCAECAAEAVGQRRRRRAAVFTAAFAVRSQRHVDDDCTHMLLLLIAARLRRPTTSSSPRYVAWLHWPPCRHMAVRTRVICALCTRRGSTTPHSSLCVAQPAPPPLYCR